VALTSWSAAPLAAERGAYTLEFVAGANAPFPSFRDQGNYVGGVAQGGRRRVARRLGRAGQHRAPQPAAGEVAMEADGAGRRAG